MRVYTIPFRAVTFNGAMDFVTLNPADDQPLSLLRFGLFAPGAVTLAQCEVALRRHSGTITPGTGGTAVSAGNAGKYTSSKIAAAGFNARYGDITTRQSATVDEFLAGWAWNNLNSLEWIATPDTVPQIIQGESLVLTAPAGFGTSHTVEGYALVGETP